MKDVLPFKTVRTLAGIGGKTMRYNVTVQAIEAQANGMNINVMVDARNVLHALELAVPKLTGIIAASGLQPVPVPPDADCIDCKEPTLEAPPDGDGEYIAPGHRGGKSGKAR